MPTGARGRRAARAPRAPRRRPRTRPHERRLRHRIPRARSDHARRTHGVAHALRAASRPGARADPGSARRDPRRGPRRPGSRRVSCAAASSLPARSGTQSASASSPRTASTLTAAPPSCSCPAPITPCASPPATRSGAELGTCRGHELPRGIAMVRAREHERGVGAARGLARLGRRGRARLARRRGRSRIRRRPPTSRRRVPWPRFPRGSASASLRPRRRPGPPAMPGSRDANPPSITG